MTRPSTQYDGELFQHVGAAQYVAVLSKQVGVSPSHCATAVGAATQPPLPNVVQ